MSKKSFHWLRKYLLTLGGVLRRQGIDNIDDLMPKISDQQGIVTPLRPMSYATALKWLRHCINAPWKQQQTPILDPSLFTIHSCKATLLSWANQQAHLLTEEERLQRGHHRVSAKGSLRLYSRDDVYPALQLQGILQGAIMQGWRPIIVAVNHAALVEPRVEHIEQYSKIGTMLFSGFFLALHIQNLRLKTKHGWMMRLQYRHLLHLPMGSRIYFKRRKRAFIHRRQNNDWPTTPNLVRGHSYRHQSLGSAR